MKYIPRPVPVEAMQWLGPDDPEHVKAFEEWVRERMEVVWMEICEHSGLLEIDCGAFRVRPTDFLILERGLLYLLDSEDFHARYQPSPSDIEGAK